MWAVSTLLFAVAAMACSSTSGTQTDAGGDSHVVRDADSDRRPDSRPGDDADRDGAFRLDAELAIEDGDPEPVEDARAADGGRVDADPDRDGDGHPRPTTVTDCYGHLVSPDSLVTIDYDQFSPTIGSHCMSTNHQRIADVERVVFVGDSVTAGSPPTGHESIYRARLASRLADRFGLEPPGMLWKMINPVDGTPVVRDSGDFSCCATWGARTDDLVRDNSQLEDCLPEAERRKTTLVIMTVGGNDISNITQGGLEGETIDALWDRTREFVDLMRQALEWFFEDPDRFPAGVFVVFGNMFEFTDGTGDVAACPAAGMAGFGASWEDPAALAEMVGWATEQYMSIAVETGTDMVFMLERFCGHGFNHDDPASPCFLGADAARWFDASCIHPNPEGHLELSNMFMAAVEE